MHCKSFFVFLAASVAASLVASPGFSQCHSGKCGGKISSGNGYGGHYGGYGVNYSGNTAPIQVGPLVTPVVNPVLDVARQFGNNDTPTEPDIDFSGDGNYDVVIEHPLSHRDIKVRSFPNRGGAEQFVNQMNQRFWITYTDQSNQPAFREAKNSGEINSIVGGLRTSGITVSNVNPVVARIVGKNDTSLESMLGNDSGQSTSAPVKTVEREAPISLAPPEGSAETPVPVDTALNALEGIWAAVARSADGELRRIELKLDSGGWARLSIPDGAGKTTTVDRRAVVEEGQLKLKDGDQEMLLGQLIQVESNQFVVTRADGQVTFLKQ